MSIKEQDYLHVRRGNNAFMLLRSPSHFHLIRIDSMLTEHTMNRLLRLYPCAGKQLHDLKLHFSSFKTDNLLSVSIAGSQTDDALTLWLNGDIQKFQLGSDYSEEQLLAFFDGYRITKPYQPPAPSLAPALIRKITWWVYGITAACAAIFYILPRPYWLWSLLCCLCLLLPLMPVLLFPDSFTIRDSDKLMEESKKANMIYAFFVPILAISLRALNDFTFDDRGLFILLGLGNVAALVLLGIILWRCKDIRHDGLLNIVVTFFVAVGVCFCLITELNYLLSIPGRQTYNASVVQTHVSTGSRSNSYYCTVKLPDGTVQEFSISHAKYKALDPGDDVTATFYNGALGIPFSTLDIP